MTRKDYVAIAAVFRDLLMTEDHDDSVYITSTILAHRIADVMKKDNPRFDADKFFKACTVPDVAELERLGPARSALWRRGA